MDNAVSFETLETKNGLKIGCATLNKPSSLNALGIDMIQLLMPQLQAWQEDPSIACVMLDGEGDKAFCAGGDVVAMYNAMAQSPKQMPESLETFFTEEYQLDFLIHSYSKPFVVWGNGIVMGGGLGLMAGGSHRIVTESSRIAMPEITIGLYPDVGGSWFLNKMPGCSGLFLGLTGASINAADALYIGLADHFIEHQSKDAFIDSLKGISWGSSVQLNREKLTDLCHDFHKRSKPSLPQGNVKAHQALIDEVTEKSSVAEVVDAILSMPAGDDKWLVRAQKSLAAGSPITAHLVYEQLKRGRDLSLAECFQMELNMSCRCGELGEFQEGVRALLIDKDNNPGWMFASVADVEPAIVESFFTSRWEAGQHPLYSLGQ